MFIFVIIAIKINCKNNNQFFNFQKYSKFISIQYFHTIQYSMQNQMLFLFLVLLFGLMACSFLGGRCGREGLTNQPTSSSSSSSSSSPPSNYHPLLPPVAASKDNYNHFKDGVSGGQIPKGSEDLYILKSQIVPQVCPAGASSSGSSGSSGSSPFVGSSPSQATSGSIPAKCPPCPACERCDEPSYDCKLVPNYNAFNSKKMPVPVLSDFSTFGM